MKHIINIQMFFIFLFLVFGLFSCTDQRDLYVSSTSMTRLETDWKSEAKLSPDIWTIAFYDESGKFVNTLITDKIVDIFYLSSNRYKTLVFNGTLHSGINYVRFRGIDRYETFEAYATVNASPKMLKYYRENRVINNPDTLAAIDKYKRIVGGRSYQEKYHNEINLGTSYSTCIGDSINYVLRRLTHKINVIVKIKGLENLVSSSSVLGYLEGFSGSVFLASRLPSHEEVTHEIIFKNNNPIGATEGEVHTVFNTFGPPLDIVRNYGLNLYFKLRDGSIFEYTNSEDVTRDVEDIIKKIKSGNTIDMVLEIAVEITLPYVEDSGVDIGVDDWSDGETIVIPVG